MRTDGQVECEQRDKKKGACSLARPCRSMSPQWERCARVGARRAAPRPSSANPFSRQAAPGARRCADLPSCRNFGERPVDARAIATATGCAALIDGALWAMAAVKAGQCVRHTNGGPSGYTRLPPAYSDSEGGEADEGAICVEIPPQIPPATGRAGRAGRR